MLACIFLLLLIWFPGLVYNNFLWLAVFWGAVQGLYWSADNFLVAEADIRPTARKREPLHDKIFQSDEKCKLFKTRDAIIRHNRAFRNGGRVVACDYRYDTYRLRHEYKPWCFDIRFRGIVHSCHACVQAA